MEATTLSRYENFGSVTRCPHGCVHVQIGHTVIVLTEEQYLRFTAMLTDSASNFELAQEFGGWGDPEQPDFPEAA